MAFVLRIPNNPRMEYYAKKASTVFTHGDAVAPDGLTETEGSNDNAFDEQLADDPTILGIIQRTTAATDSDYASETKVPLLIDEFGIWEVPVATGTAAAGDEQGYVDLDDTAIETSLDITGSTEDHFFITDYISGTSVRGKICSWAHMWPPVHAS